MSSVSCFGRVLPKPASKFPVKRYNFLVPDIFPIKPVSIDEDLPSVVKKNIEKLQEYVSKNSERAPKVSRRLDRKIRKCLLKKKLGSIKIAVHAFIYLLKHSSREDAVLYAQELVKEQPGNGVGRDDQCVPAGISGLFSSSQSNRARGPLIKVILEHHSIHLRILGAELLAHFLRQQADGDNQAEIESLVPIVSRNCRHPTPAELHGVSQQKVQELRTAGLRALRELIVFMERLSAAPQHLDDLIAPVLDNIDYKEVAQAVPLPDAKKPALETMKSTALDFSFCKDSGMGDDFAGSTTPGEIATQIMMELSHLTRAARSAESILTALLRALDERHGWKANEPVVDASFEILHQAFAKQHQQFLLFTVLLRHAASADYLSVSERACLIQLAVREGLSQERHFSSAVLAQCLTYLPAQLPLPSDFAVMRSAPLHADGDELGMPQSQLTGNGRLTEGDLRAVVLDGVTQVSRNIEDTGILVDELMRILTKLNTPVAIGEVNSADAVVAVLECVAAALRPVESLPKEARRFPSGKKHNLFLVLLALQLGLPALPRLQIHRLLQVVVPVGLGESKLSSELVSGFLTTVYSEILDPHSVPESFAAISGTFATVMGCSSVRELAAGLQFVHTLWSMALKDQELSRLLGCIRHAAILLLANSMLLLLSVLLEFPDLEMATIDMGGILKPCLRISSIDVGQLEALTSSFPSNLEGGCTVHLRNISENELELTGRLTKLCSQVSRLRDEFGSQLEDIIGTYFQPDSMDTLLQRASSRPLSQGRCSTPEGSNCLSEADITGQARAADFSRKVLEVFSRTPSWKEKEIPSPRPRSVQELVAVDEEHVATGRKSDGDDIGMEVSEPNTKKKSSRTDALQSILSLLDNQDGSSTKVKSLDMDDLALGLDPLS